MRFAWGFSLALQLDDAWVLLPGLQELAPQLEVEHANRRLSRSSMLGNLRLAQPVRVSPSPVLRARSQRKPGSGVASELHTEGLDLGKIDRYNQELLSQETSSCNLRPASTPGKSVSYSIVSLGPRIALS